MLSIPLPFPPTMCLHCARSDDPETGWEPSTSSAADISSANNSGETARKPIHPDPAQIQPVKYGVDNTLGAQFRGTGLQIIVKMTNIELTPETPETAAPSPERLVRNYLESVQMCGLDS